MDKSGAILGPIGAYFILGRLGETASAFKILFLVALVPAVFAVLLLFVISDKRVKPTQRENIFRAYRTFGPDFKHYLFTAGVFSLAYFSFGFLLLKAYSVGFAIQSVTLLYALYNVSFVVAAPLLGKLGDRVGRRKIIALGYILYFLMCVGFIFASAKWQVVALFLVFGIFFAIDESQTKAYITDMEKTEKGTRHRRLQLLHRVWSTFQRRSLPERSGSISPNYAFGFAGVTSAAALVFFISRRANTAGSPS